MQDRVNSILTSRRTHSSSVTSIGCFHGHSYTYKYPICWFRVLFCCLFLDQPFRTLLLNAGISASPLHEEPQKQLRQFMYNMASYMYHAPPYQEIFKISTNPNVDLDDMCIYFMHLLGYTELKPGFARKTMLNFFSDIFHKCYPEIVYATGKWTGTSITDYKLHNAGSQPQFLVVDYGRFIDPKSDLTLYIEHDNVLYSLTSMFLADYKTLPNCLSVGHFMPIFSCHGRYYTTERLNNAHQIIGDVDLIEHIVCGSHDFSTVIPMKFNFDKGMRVGIYMPRELDFTNDEIKLLKHLMLKDTSLTKRIAILTFFASNMTFEPGSHNISSSFEEKSKISLKIILHTKEYQNVTLLEIDRTNVNACVNQIDSEIIKIFEETQLSLPELSTIAIRNPRHKESLLWGILPKLYTTQIASVGGGKSKSKSNYTSKSTLQKIRFMRRVYTIKNDKNKQRYITVKKEKVYLRDIKGKYRWVDPVH